MSNPTSNFGWQMPTATDLVTDLPADFEVFGQAVDTSLADLKGGTTGQVLSKTSGTDMDFTWVAQDDSNAIQNAIVDAKGDLIAASAADTPARLAVGADGETLVCDSSTSTGLRYQGNFAAGKNKFINAAFDIWQRGTAATDSLLDTRTYLADRWFAQANSLGAGRFSTEQAIDAPAAANAGTFSLKAVVTTADTSTAAGEQYWLGQIIEGNNFESFQFGTASAQTITVSFWVKSNITGTFGFAIRNSSADRSYVSTYTISAANTWEKKTITIAGDTSGTWVKDSGIGARMEWVLNAGTDYQTSSPNSWTASNDMTTSSQTNLFATLSNSFQLTAVQVEAGSVATAFQTATGTIQGELAACQRYYFRESTGSGIYSPYAFGGMQSTTQHNCAYRFPVVMRTAPTLSFSAANTFIVQTIGNSIPSAISASSSNLNNSGAVVSSTIAATTAGNAGALLGGGTASFIEGSAEL